MLGTKVYWIHTLSPTHVGVGRGMDYIDLPIDRDGVTNWPVIRSSGLKGVWRDWANQKGLAHVDLAFGRASDTDSQNSNSGALMLTDAKIVCMPVRSFRGTFAWCVSPMALQMLRRTLEFAKIPDLPQAPRTLKDGDAHHYHDDETKITTALKEEDQIFLEDLNFHGKPCPTATKWAKLIAEQVFPNDPVWQEQFKRRFVVISDLTFDFLCETGTEVHTRVKINDELKIVEKHALWTEESLPAETILVGIVQCDRVFRAKDSASNQTSEDLLTLFTKEPLTLQIGGKATIGRGLVRWVFDSTHGDIK